MTKKLAVIAAAVLIAVLAAVLAGCGSSAPQAHGSSHAQVQAATDWYANGQRFGQESGARGEGGSSAATWCSNIAAGHEAVSGAGLPPAGSGSAFTQWSEGCENGYDAGYAQYQQDQAVGTPSPSSPASSAPPETCAQQVQSWSDGQVAGLEGAVKGYNSDMARPDPTGAFKGYAGGEMSTINQMREEMSVSGGSDDVPSCADPRRYWSAFTGDLQHGTMQQAQADYEALNNELSGEGYQAPVPYDP